MLPPIWPLVAHSRSWSKNSCKSAFYHDAAKADAFHVVIDDCDFKIILGGFISPPLYQFPSVPGNRGNSLTLAGVESQTRNAKLIE